MFVHAHIGKKKLKRDTQHKTYIQIRNMRRGVDYAYALRIRYLKYFLEKN